MATDLQAEHEPRLSELVSGIVNDGQELLKQQLAVFRAELKEDARKTQEALTLIGVGAAVGLVALALLGHGLAYLVAAGFHWPYWGGLLSVGGVLAAVGGGVAWAGVEKFRSFNPLPDRSAAALKETMEWKTQTPSASR